MTNQILYQSHKIVYNITGNGNPVILVHGFGEDHHIWDGMTDDLKNEFTFILPDLPGSGASAMTDDMTIEGMAEVVHEIIHAEGINACPVIGHSMGGYITLALAEKYYNHVSAFGLFHSTAFADSDEKKTARRKSIEFIREHGSDAFLKTTIPNLFSQPSKENIPEKIDAFIQQQHFSPEALIKYYQSMMARPGRTAVLANAQVPVLFVMGKYDMAAPLADCLQQCHLPGISHVHILQNAAHMGMMEEPEKSREILRSFLYSI